MDRNVRRLVMVALLTALLLTPPHPGMTGESPKEPVRRGDAARRLELAIRIAESRSESGRAEYYRSLARRLRRTAAEGIPGPASSGRRSFSRGE